MFGLRLVSSRELNDIRETITKQQRALEDIGWVSVNSGSPQEGLNLSGEAFRKVIQRSRLYYNTNPLAGHWVNLTTYFVFGEGVGAPKAKDKNLQEVITGFWNDRDNKIALTSFMAQQMLCNKLQIEGNLFFALFSDDAGNVRVRIINTDEIADIIREPSDRMRTLFYKVRNNPTKYNYKSDSYDIATTGVIYYPDMDNFNPEDYGVPETKLNKDVAIYHVKINCDINDKFGIPELYRGLDWIKANKDMAGDLATLIRSLSTIAWKKKIKGTPAQVASLKTLYHSKTDLSNVGPSAGSTQVENQNLDLTPVDTPTGGASIGKEGMRQMKLMVCSASGLFEHYFGDPSTGNLATATSMELPMIKKFLYHQQVWSGIYAGILQYQINKKIDLRVLPGSGEYNDLTGRMEYRRDFDDTIDHDFPPIIEKELKPLAESLQIAVSNGMCSQETAARIFLLASGQNNIDDEIQKITIETEAAEKKAAKQQKPQPGQVGDKDEIAEAGRGEGKGVGGSRQGDGGASTCVCPKCGHEVTHSKGEPCNEKKCPKCGVAMAGKSSASAKEEPSKPIKEAIEVPSKDKALHHVKKSSYLLQRMNGYKKALAAVYSEFRESVMKSAKAKGEKDSLVGNIDDLAESLGDFSDGMKKAAETYFPIAIDIGKKYLQSYIKTHKIKETLFEAARKGKSLLAKKLEWNSKYVDKSLIPDVRSGISDALRATYGTEEEFFEAVSKKVATFESRIGSYAGAMWSVEEAAVKEAGKGTGLTANFAGADDDSTCDGCKGAMAGNPWPIDDIPEPGSFECNGNCRHAIQILETQEA